MNSRERDAEHIRDIWMRESAEEAQLDDARQFVVVLLQLDQRLVEVEQIGVTGLELSDSLIEASRFDTAPPLLCSLGAHVIHQHRAHRLRGDA